MDIEEIKEQSDELYNHFYSKLVNASDSNREIAIKATAEIMKAQILADSVENLQIKGRLHKIFSRRK